MVRLDDEMRYGAMLGVMQRDMDMMRATLRNIANDLSTRMSTLESRLQSEGKKPSSDGEYQRCYQLYSLFGGLYVMLEGIDGVMSSTVIELLRGEDKEVIEDFKENDK